MTERVSANSRAGLLRPRVAARVLRRILRVSTTVLLVLLAALVGSVAVGVISGQWQLHPVLSGSMRPSFAPGGLVVSHRVPISDVSKGDIIVFHRPGTLSELVVHRVARIRFVRGQAVLTTKGDANADVDPWRITLRGDDAYRVVGTVPYVGYAATLLRWSSTRQVLVALGIALGALAVLRLLVPASMWPGRRRHRRDDDASSVGRIRVIAAEPIPVDGLGGEECPRP